MNTQVPSSASNNVSSTLSEMVNSWYDLGMRYLNSAEPDAMKHAMRWLFKAAINGHVDASFRLGQLNERRGTSHFKQAFHWYRKASLHGHIEAMTALARAYNYGIGTAINFEQARYWQQRCEMHLDVFDAFYKTA